MRWTSGKFQKSWRFRRTCSLKTKIKKAERSFSTKITFFWYYKQNRSYEKTTLPLEWLFSRFFNIAFSFLDIWFYLQTILLQWPLFSVDILIPSWWRSLLYRNQSIDLQRKSMDWFLYDRGLRHERVKWKLWE